MIDLLLVEIFCWFGIQDCLRISSQEGFHVRNQERCLKILVDGFFAQTRKQFDAHHVFEAVKIGFFPPAQGIERPKFFAGDTARYQAAR